MKKRPKVVRFVEMTHLFIVGSLHYWRGMIRSGLIYGFVDAARSTLFFLQTTKALSLIEPKVEKNTLGKTRESMPFGKGLSFVWTILLSICLSGFLTLRNGLNQSAIVFLLITSLTLFSVYHTFLVLAISLYVEKETVCSGKWLYAYTLDYMIRNPFKSLFVLMLTISAIGMAYFNLVLFFFLVPSIYWLMIQKGMQHNHKVKVA